MSVQKVIAAVLDALEVPGARRAATARALEGFAAELAGVRGSVQLSLLPAAFSAPAVPLSTDGIIDAVAREWDTTSVKIRSSDRQGAATEPRYVAIWLIRQLLPEVTLVEIGLLLGGRDHTSVIYGLERAQERLRRDARYRSRVQRLFYALDPSGLRQSAPAAGSSTDSAGQEGLRLVG